MNIIMEKYILASFCNIPFFTVSPILCIKLQVDSNGSVDFAPVTLGYSQPIDTVTGMARSDGRIYITFGSKGKIYVSVKSEYCLEDLFCQELPEVTEAHSVLVLGQYFYIVSTGTDQVIRYEINDNRLVHPNCVWEASQENKDTHHMNSIVEMDGELYVSAFGPKKEKLWASATDGYIYNITSGKRIIEGIHHPHSLTVHNRQLYFCESHNGTFCSREGSLFKLNGYSRGIVWLSDELVAVATSVGRKVSRSTGLFANPADPGEKAGTCNLSVRQVPAGDTVISSDLSWFGPEVYDLLLLDLPVDLLKISTRSYIAERETIGTNIENHKQATNQINAQLVESQELVKMLNLQISGNQQDIKLLNDQNGINEQKVQGLSFELAEIKRSKAWMFALWIRKTRVKLIPPNSLREVVSRRIFRGVSGLLNWSESIFRNNRKGID